MIMWMRALASGAVLAACAVVAAGCATITKGTTQSVAIATPGVTGATCTLSSGSIGQKVVQTPATVTLEKGQDNIQVVCKKQCYQDGVGIIASHTEAMAAGNVILGGPIGLGVDAVSGAMNRYNGDNQFTMVPIQGCTTGA